MPPTIVRVAQKWAANTSRVENNKRNRWKGVTEHGYSDTVELPNQVVEIPACSEQRFAPSGKRSGSGRCRWNHTVGNGVRS